MLMRPLAVVVFFVATLISASAGAEEWVAKMFSERSHNFGTVARGADAVHRFAIKNIYKQDIELLSVRSSCGCTTPTIEKKVLKTGEVGYVTAIFNTRAFTGVHGATLTVEVAWNDNGVRRRGETQLRVDGNIRGDVVIKPGAVRFEQVDQGKISEQVVEVSYQGYRGDWKIVDVRGVSDHLEVEMTPTSRSTGRISYELLVRLKDSAPAGYLNEQLVIITNDPQSPRIPLHISGRVVSEIFVAESVLLGEVARGDRVSKKVVVRGKRPFRITSIQSSDEDRFQFKTDDRFSERHVVEIIFNAANGVGTVKEPISILTDLGKEHEVKLTAYATVVPGQTETAPVEPDALVEAGAAGSASSPPIPVSSQ